MPEFVEEPLLVEARLLPDGAVQPIAFVWRDRGYRIADWGRQWVEEIGGVRWRCYLVRTADGETFELRLDRVAGQWMLSRAWLPAGIA